MTTIFHDMIHKEIEVYVDDVIIKSKNTTDHMEDLRKFFNRLQRYNLNLNPVKCAFGIPVGKLLGFIKPMPTSKLAKWQILLSEFDIVYITQKVVKGHALADHLDENPVDGEYEPLKTYFPDEDVSFIGEDIAKSYDGWRMFFDGAANFKGVGIGAVLVSKTGQYYPELRKRFTKTQFQYVPRVQNEFTDALDTLSSMIQYPDKIFIDYIPIKIHDQPAYYGHVEEEADGKPGFHDIKGYLAKEEYPELANLTVKRTIRRLSNNFFYNGGILYKRTPYLGLLRCVDAKEA
ncbi:uncharacterized protein [Nicotiana sylvestris]|uniref:uncharacterized protein n=1 Tax=Nicotiana sylvestris TaxID=4096 RepID=UPI00388C4AEC